jgi:hypothetical protein
MSRIAVALPEFDITHDVSRNPEIILMMAEDDAAECDATESTWLAAQAVTKPKSSNYDQE